jgi:hypothetical protein
MECHANSCRVKAILVLASLFLIFAFPRDSQARYDPSYRWRTISTEGFIIYYPEGHEQFAQRVLSLCPEVYGDVPGYFGTTPRPCPWSWTPGQTSSRVHEHLP